MTDSTPFSLEEPKIIHQFPEGELVQHMAVIKTKKHWWSRKKESLYVYTNKGLYVMGSK